MSQVPKLRDSAMQVLLHAEKKNMELGHANLGYLSRSNGFMPKKEPFKNLPSSFQLWDQICAQTPNLIKELSFRSTMDKMEVLLPTEDQLNDKYLGRASMLLGFFAHAYVNCAGELLTQDNLPDSIMTPWIVVSKRLNRPEPFLSYFDLIAYNWQFKSDRLTERTLENMNLLYPIFNCKEEHNLYLIQTEMMACASPMVQATAQAQEATLINDHDLLASSLDTLIACVQHIAHVSFGKLAYNKRSNSHLDPVVFTKTMMSFAVPIKKGIPGPSGTSFPYAHLLDEFIGRKQYDEGISQEALKIRALYPQHVRHFLQAISNISIAEYIQKSGSALLAKKYSQLIEAYSGEEGFLNIHRKRVYSFIQTSFKVGRPQTIGGFEASNTEEWAAVDTALQNMKNERPRCPFAQRPIENLKKKVPSHRIQRPNDEKLYTLADLAKHSNEANGYWTCINSNIIDLSQYLNKHPGGEASLLEYVGSDSSKEFTRMHADSPIANKLTEKFSIGRLQEPEFKNEKMISFWQAHKAMLHCIVEDFNIYRLEISMQNKEYFPNHDKNIQTPYKKFIQDHSTHRFKTTYINKLIKDTSKMRAWMDLHDPNWKKACPFSKFTKRTHNLSKLFLRQKKLSTNYYQDFLGLKIKAIHLTEKLEQIDKNASEPPISIRAMAGNILKLLNELC